MSLLTLADARTVAKPFVDNGSCSPTLLDARITEACARLVVKADWPYTTQVIRIRVDNEQFPLPRECEAIRWANIDNVSARMFNQAYEFLETGPGEIKHLTTTSGYKQLVDAGAFPTMYDIPPIETFDDDAETCTDRTLGTGYQLMAFSTDVADVNSKIYIRGLDRLNNDMDSGTAAFSPTESISINRWEDGVEGTIHGALTEQRISEKYYRQVTAWHKDATKGYISLYAVNTSNNYMYFLGKAHPMDTAMSWRRIKIMGQLDCSNILAICKMKAMTLSDAKDVLPIQNLYAIKLMVMAIAEENAKNIQVALTLESNAVRLLTEQKQDHEVSGGVPVIIDLSAEMQGGVSSGYFIY